MFDNKVAGSVYVPFASIYAVTTLEYVGQPDRPFLAGLIVRPAVILRFGVMIGYFTAP